MSTRRLSQWRYYFIDLPLFSCGSRSGALTKRMLQVCEQELSYMKEGYLLLCEYLKLSPSDSDIEDFARRSFWVKVVRESDAYTCLKMSRRSLQNYFEVEGIENLRAACDGRRPVVLLTGHYGSFFIPAIAFAKWGYKVYPIARTVDNSADTPIATRFYQKLNYKFSESRFPAHYVYTNFSGKIAREIVPISNSGGIFWAAIDLPRRLYNYKRRPVNFFGMEASLPAGIIPWGVKKNAVFLTSWNAIDGIDEMKFYRRLEIEPPITASDGDSILQQYARRLERRVAAQPWQWLALQVIHQFKESENQNG